MKRVFIVLVCLSSFAKADSDFNHGVYVQSYREKIFTAPLDKAIKSPKQIRELLAAASISEDCSSPQGYKLLDQIELKTEIAAGGRVDSILVQKWGENKMQVLAYFAGYSEADHKHGYGFAQVLCK